ncbi:hypothetical protein [Spirosoma sp.]|uniref:hypothetical protein n=1 Tax=Spirosoma sp. TaxID=1899569 RepID=UPI003B3AF66E
MKRYKALIILAILAVLGQAGRAQSTTGARSGGSTASTGAGYLTEGKRPATTSPQSMTIADEGSSRDYMYVPPTQKNRSASPDGSDSSSSDKPKATARKKTVQPNRPK